MIDLKKHPRLDWMSNGIRPYVYVRPEHQIKNPGENFDLDWFKDQPLIKNPLKVSECEFGNMIMRLEGSAFEKASMAMPRWVFYDCAVMPGFVAGFAIHRDLANKKTLDLLTPAKDQEWIPISLFIVIPTMGHNEWVAHNLSSINSKLDESERYYGLGYLTKAYGLWYANIQKCCGMTQWLSPALKLHTHYGPFEILTAYTPLHSYAQTLTYKLDVDAHQWESFFDSSYDDGSGRNLVESKWVLDPQSEASLKNLQDHIEKTQERFYLNGTEIRRNKKNDLIKLYNKKGS